MSFSDVKDLQATRKFELIRITPARYISEDLTSIGGGLYTYSTSYFISSVYESGTELTKSTGTLIPGTYSFNGSLLTIYPINSPSSSNPIVMFHHLFMTGEVYRTWYENPEDNSTPLRDWSPILISSPSVLQSVENLLVGTLSSLSRHNHILTCLL